MALEAADVTDFKGLPPPRNPSRDDWSAMYVAKAEEIGLSVYSPTLDVRTPATRGEMVQTILEALKIHGDQGSRSLQRRPAHSPYAQAIATAAAYGLIQGDGGRNTFRPDDPINRAEAAKISSSLAKELLKK